MIFALKIIRKILGLFVKVLLLPVRLVQRLVGDGNDEDYDIELDDESQGADSAEGASTVGEAEASSRPPEQYPRWFEYGFYGLGAFQLLGALLLLPVVMSPAPAAGLLGGVLLGGVVFAAVTFAIGIGVRRESKVAWVVGLIYLPVVALLSLGSPESMIVMVPAVLAMGYVGWNGRAAVEDTSEPTTDDADVDAPSIAEPRTEDVSGDDPEGDVDLQTADTPEAPSGVVTDTESLSGGASAEDATGDTIEAADGDDESNDAASEKAASEDEATRETPASPLEPYEPELSSDDPDERRAACDDLAAALDADEVPADAAVDRLSELLDTDADPAVRRAACEALGAAGTPAAERTLEDHRLDADTGVSRAATRALRSDTFS